MKKIIFSLAVLSSAVASADSYLYWMVDTSDTYNYARISAIPSGGGSQTYLNIYDGAFEDAYNDASVSPGGSVSKSTVDTFKTDGDAFYAALGSVDPAASTFIIELYNESGKFISQSTLSGSSIAQYIYKGGTSVPLTAAWSASSFAIPEPSSGLLMLVGCAVLGLRRRKQKNA